MVELFSGQIQAQYGQAYIELTGSFDGDMGGCFRGQGNGLCGARVPAILFLVTGLHTGVVGIDIRLFDAEPSLDEGWEEIVEVSFSAPGGEIRLVEWAADEGVRMPLAAGSYRARYQARGMAAGNALNTNDADTPVDGYRLDLWAAPPAADRVVKQTAEIAAYWHDWARQLAV